jgi:hypothetical protein
MTSLVSSDYSLQNILLNIINAKAQFISPVGKILFLVVNMHYTI